MAKRTAKTTTSTPAAPAALADAGIIQRVIPLSDAATDRMHAVGAIYGAILEAIPRGERFPDRVELNIVASLQNRAARPTGGASVVVRVGSHIRDALAFNVSVDAEKISGG